LIAQILTYWLIVQVLGLLGLPFSGRLLGALPDRGYAFAKTLGLLSVCYLAWLLAMLGLAPFGPGLLSGCALVLALGALALVRSGQGQLWVWLRQRWRLVLFYECVFAVALVFLAMQRSYEYEWVGPHPWGTERAMDYAFFNAIRASSIFPPHDPWMAGFSINYYYFGYLTMAAVSLVAGLAPAVSYNLSLALIFALTALGVAGAVVNLCELTQRREGRQAAATPGRSLGVGLAAIGAAVLVLVAGNQGGALQVISGSPMILALDGGDMARALANGLGARAPLTLAQTWHGSDFDGTTVITPTDTLQNFNWWWPSRALWGTPPGSDARQYAITEFPFFSFWLGDMHPHVMSLPFCLLALALAINTAVRADTFVGRGRRGWLELALACVAIGSLYAINSWDYPTYLLLVLGALLLRHVRQRGVGLMLDRAGWRDYAAQALTLTAGSLVLFLPFFLTFKSLVGGKEPLVDLPILGAISRTISLVLWTKTPLHSFLIIFGLFLAPILAFVALAARLPDGVGERDRPAIPHAAFALAGLAALAVGIFVGFPLVALLPLALYAGMAALALARAGYTAESFALWACALICLVCLGTEVIYLRDVFDNRMNTIFKFYYQAWLVWGTLAGYALWWLIRLPGLHTWPAQIGRAVALALFVPLLAGALVYPWLTSGKAFGQGHWYGLDGQTPPERVAGGAEAVAWLRAHAPGEAVILEAAGGPDDMWYSYNDMAGVSASTGRATVMGWPGHESQWRAGDPATREQIQPRRQDVVTIYSTTDAGLARELLKKYNVRYVYIGAMERSLYPPDGIAKLPQLGTIVFQQGDVTIVEVE
jgi:YYY domain-containing protein